MTTMNTHYNCHQHTLLWVKNNFFFSFPIALWPNTGHGLLILEVLRSHNEVSWSVGLFWLSDQIITQTSICQHTTLTTDKHPCPWIQTHNLSRQAAAVLCLRPRGQWDQRVLLYHYYYIVIYVT